MSKFLGVVLILGAFALLVYNVVGLVRSIRQRKKKKQDDKKEQGG